MTPPPNDTTKELRSSACRTHLLAERAGLRHRLGCFPARNRIEVNEKPGCAERVT